MDSEKELLLVFSVFFALFGVLYWTTYRFFSKPRGDFEFGQRIVSLVHASVSLWWLFIIVKHRWASTDDWAGPSSREERLALSFSLAYFLWDTLMQCILDFSFIYVMHHVLSAIALVHGVWLGYCGAAYSFCLLLGEATNPVMNLRWLLLRAGRSKTWYFYVITGLWYLLFGLIRIVGAPVVWWGFSFAPWPLRHIVPPLVFLGSANYYFNAIRADLRGDVWY